MFHFHKEETKKRSEIMRAENRCCNKLHNNTEKFKRDMDILTSRHRAELDSIKIKLEHASIEDTIKYFNELLLIHEMHKQESAALYNKSIKIQIQ